MIRVPKAVRRSCCRPACTAVTPRTWCLVFQAISSTAKSRRSSPHARRVPRQRTSVRSSKASYLEIVCPNHEAALALVSTARVWASPPSRVSYAAPNASPCAIPTPSNVCSFLWVRRAPHASGPESVPTAKLGAKPTVWPTSTTPTCVAAPSGCGSMRQGSSGV